MEDSSFYQYDNNIYYITSYKAKFNVYHMSSVIRFNLTFDLMTILLYSMFYKEFLIALPDFTDNANITQFSSIFTNFM